MTDALSHRPPLRYHALTGMYDRAAEWTASASRIQARVARIAAGLGAQRVMDVGCGTGNLTRALSRALPAAYVCGVDPDARALSIASAKLTPADAKVHLVQAYAQSLPESLVDFDLVASCLVFHHLDPPIKYEALRAIHRALRPGGRVLIADFDRPTSAPKRLAFNLVRWLDGAPNTADHAGGSFPRILGAPPFAGVEHLETHDVPIGTISIWQLRRSCAADANADLTTHLMGGQQR